MCDGQEWVEAKWNCVFKPDFENPSGSIFSEQRGIIYQDCHAPMGEGHVYPPGEHAGYYTAAPDALGGAAGRPDLVDLLARDANYADIPEERRERRTFKVWNGRRIQDAHMAAGGTLESFFEEHGFCLVHAPTQVTDFLDADQCVQRRGGV